MSSIIDKAFSQAYNEAAEHYDKDELDACVEKAKELLDDNAAPRYHRMKTWILLGNVLGDWEEANDCFIKAQSMWHIVRRWHPAGEDQMVDASLEELRVSLEELKQTLAAEKSNDYDPDTAVEEQVAAHDARVEEERAMEEHPDETALRKAQASGLKPSFSLRIEEPAGKPNDEHKKIPSGESNFGQLYVPPSRRASSAPGERTEEILRKTSWR